MMYYAGLDFIGVSRAAMGTAIAIPQLKLQLDAGMNVFNFHPDAVFVSHCHADHSFRLTHFVSRSKPPRYFMPSAMTELTENYLFSSQQLSAGVAFDKEGYEVNHISVGVQPGETLTDFCKNKQLGAHVIRCHHRDIPCVGYAFFIKYKALKSCYQGLDKKEIGQLAKSGENVTEEMELPLFAFLGDTTPDVFDHVHPNSMHAFLEKGECSYAF
jgi:ribonuclease Z